MTTNNDTHTTYDVLVVGGGPAGLAAALTLGRARKRVLLTDSGPRRNAAATHVYNFLTRDGTPPDEMRRVAREQLAHYPNVAVRDVGVRAITGEKGAFAITLDDDRVIARRVVLATGMIDEPIAIDGFTALWGRSIFQCPYCHGWRHRVVAGASSPSTPTHHTRSVRHDAARLERRRDDLHARKLDRR